MAALASLSKRLLVFSPNFRSVSRSYKTSNQRGSMNKFKSSVGWVFGGAVTLYLAHNYSELNAVHAFKLRKRDDDLHKAVRLTTRERRFIKFASVEYDGQLYMTPQDFLDSVVESVPRPRLKRRILSDNEIEVMKNATPNLRHGNPQMFRTLRDKGIVSYTEYLFLLSILTKPQTGFRIAFNMFDIDGNERVDKTEFLVIRRLLGGSLKERDLDEATTRALRSLVGPSDEALRAKAKLRDSNIPEANEIISNSYIYSYGAGGCSSCVQHAAETFMEKIFSHAWRGRHGGSAQKEANALSNFTEPDREVGKFDEDQGLQRRHAVETTLTTHFFGKTGSDELKYDGFRRFMENLQREVLELEFHEFSKGHDTISEMDFAKILLRYTYLDTDEYDKYLDRLLDRSTTEVGISFDEFRVFYEFLNNLEDFTIAMRMYTLADHPISKDEFHRAVKICTGTSLTTHIVDTVFALFDVDGDGQLSYKEFIAIMKDRLHRGSKSQTRSEGWEAFKFCLKQEMKAP